jgi:hypothetical protein
MPKNIVPKWALLALICGIACDAEPDAGVPLETQVSEPELAVEDEFRASWECVLETFGEEEEEEEERDIYCLAKCEGYKYTRAVKSTVDLKEVTDYWCEKRAKRFCEDLGKEFDKWCWGEREEEEEEDDDN